MDFKEDAKDIIELKSEGIQWRPSLGLHPSKRNAAKEKGKKESPTRRLALEVKQGGTE